MHGRPIHNVLCCMVTVIILWESSVLYIHGDGKHGNLTMGHIVVLVTMVSVAMVTVKLFILCILILYFV